MMNEDENLIPKKQVLEDMYNPDGGMEVYGARSYYYTHYATPEERAQMDEEDRRRDMIFHFILGFICGTIGIGLYQFLSWLF